MFALAVDLDIFRSWRDDLRQCRFGIEGGAELVEVGNLQTRAQAHRAGIWRQFPQDQAQQRGLARAVGADQTNSVATHHSDRKVANHGLVAERFVDVGQFGYQLPALLARVEREAGRTEPLASRGSFATQCFEAQHAAFVARAPCFDTLADPDFFLGEDFVELGVLDRFVPEHLSFARLIGGERAREAAQDAAIEFDDARRQAVEEAPVMGDEQQRHAAAAQQFFQPFDGREVEVVGRFVEQ